MSRTGGDGRDYLAHLHGGWYGAGGLTKAFFKPKGRSYWENQPGVLQ